MTNSLAARGQPNSIVQSSKPASSQATLYLLLIAAAGIPISLLWDFSWESTVGIDLVWSAAHTATYLAVTLAGCTALLLVFRSTRSSEGRSRSIRLGSLYAPLGAWITLWGGLAFCAGVLFDRWWQSSYGLSAGIWHPPQILKTVSFFAILVGIWLLWLAWQNGSQEADPTVGNVAFAASGAIVLALITVVTLVSIYPNRQHSASFYKLSCAVYPLVLAMLTVGGRSRWSATAASLCYTLIVCLMIWVLPLFAAKPQVPPIYNQMDHLMPPPFPLLLIVPALAFDALALKFRRTAQAERPWLQAWAAGIAFFILFTATQWTFAQFLLSDLADNWFFAGGGRHWPFFLKIDSTVRDLFWETPRDELNVVSSLVCAGLAVISSAVGAVIGSWMKRVQR